MGSRALRIPHDLSGAAPVPLTGPVVVVDRRAALGARRRRDARCAQPDHRTVAGAAVTPDGLHRTPTHLRRPRLGVRPRSDARFAAPTHEGGVRRGGRRSCTKSGSPPSATPTKRGPTFADGESTTRASPTAGPTGCWHLPHPGPALEPGSGNRTSDPNDPHTARPTSPRATNALSSAHRSRRQPHHEGRQRIDSCAQPTAVQVCGRALALSTFRRRRWPRSWVLEGRRAVDAERDVVDVAEPPVLARFVGLDERMLRAHGSARWRGGWGSCRSSRRAHTTCTSGGAPIGRRCAGSPRSLRCSVPHRRPGRGACSRRSSASS